MKNQKLGLASQLAKLHTASSVFKRYSFIIFIIFVSVLYGYVIFRINSLASLEPSSDAVTSHVKAAQVPHIDEQVIKQLESLQDNSVSVQALFDQARSNPF